MNTSTELNAFFDQKEFVVLTCQQIDKDLGGLYVDGFELTILDDVPPIQQITKKLTVVLEEMSRHSMHSLTQFLYKVDLPEKEARVALEWPDEFENLAFKIVRREAQKVYLRKRFS